MAAHPYFRFRSSQTYSRQLRGPAEIHCAAFSASPPFGRDPPTRTSAEPSWTHRPRSRPMNPLTSSPTPSAATARSLGLVTATALVVANMIGTGVFTTSGFLLAELKSPWPVLAVWLAGGLMAALGALCYGALARRFPESGGEYLLLCRTLHSSLGYVAGWISLLVGFSAPLAAAAMAFGTYAGPWLPRAGPQFMGTVLILIFSVLHAANVRGGA